MLAGDMQRVTELQKEASSLQEKLFTRCDAGNRLLKDCSHVNERIDLLQIDRRQRINQHQRAKETLEAELASLRCRLGELKNEAAPMNAEIADIDKRDAALLEKHAKALSADQLLNDDIEDYEYYESIASGSSQSADIANAERKLEATSHRHQNLQIQRKKERDAVEGRRRAISQSMQAVAKSLPSFQWGVFSDEDKHRNHPFRMGPMHSTTFKVLEILAGDIACLLDSTSAESFHPGFLLHDSPREAEMSEAILWSLLECVATSGGDSFQYIVTTSTEPPDVFQPFLRLRLSSESEDDLLLRHRVGAEQRLLA